MTDITKPKLTFKEAIAVRDTPKFKAIESRIQELEKEMTSLFSELATEYPIEDHYWALFGVSEVRVFPVFAGYVDNDNY